MTSRFDIKAWRESSQGKAYTVRIGSAWVDQKGVTRLSFDALPIPDKDGRVQCFLEEQRERSETAPARQEVGTQGFARQMAPGGAGRASTLDDDIPF